MYNCIDIPVDPTALSSTFRTNFSLSLINLGMYSMLHTNILCHPVSCISGIAKVDTGPINPFQCPTNFTVVLHFKEKLTD